MIPAQDDPRLTCYSRTLQARVDEWLATAESRNTPGAALYGHLPALFRFLAGVALDHRVIERERTATLSALKYVIAPYDLIPEGLVGVSGFRDDLVLAALTVERLAGRVSQEVLSEHWEQDGDPLAVSRLVLDSAPVMIGPEILEQLQAWHEATV
jgi:uncharacterized membrane protein YkvA (DUF1232 family)